MVVHLATDDVDQLQVRADLRGVHNHYLALPAHPDAVDHPHPERTVDADELPKTVDDQETVGTAVAVDLFDQLILTQGLYSFWSCTTPS